MVMDKPPYQIPSMGEISSIPHNGMNVVSTFTGAGGSCLGFRMAGFKTLWASEFIQSARDTYRANFPGVPVDERDIRDVTPDDILRVIDMEPGEVDVVEGSPPCASFSTSGKRHKKWGQVFAYSDTQQRTDDLFWEFARIVRGIQPRAFIAENVSGLIKGKAKGYFKMILAELESCGYDVRAKLLNALWLGVPQNRERVIFVGVRKDLECRPMFPRPLPYTYTVREAWEGVGRGESWDISHTEKVKKYWIETKKRGTSLFAGVAEDLTGTQSFFNHRRLMWDKPGYTLVQGARCIYHPDEMRTLSIPEMKRLQSFPDDFVLTGSFGQQWERIGRSVPPLMMKAVAEVLRDEVLT